MLRGGRFGADPYPNLSMASILLGEVRLFYVTSPRAIYTGSDHCSSRGA